MARRLDARQVREAVFLVIGLSTPLGILAVNGSAFVMGHLPEFRLAIAGCALASGLSLNGLGAWAALNRAQRYLPDLWLIFLPVAVTFVSRRLNWASGSASPPAPEPAAPAETGTGG